MQAASYWMCVCVAPVDQHVGANFSRITIPSTPIVVANCCYIDMVEFIRFASSALCRRNRSTSPDELRVCLMYICTYFLD